MSYFDLIIVIIACFQPIIIGFVVTIGISQVTLSFSVFKKLSAHKSKVTSTRLYECSTNYRLAHFVIFELNAIALVLLYLIYDVDFMFFLAETTTLSNYSMTNLFMLAYLVFLFILSLCIDSQAFGIK